VPVRRTRTVAQLAAGPLVGSGAAADEQRTLLGLLLSVARLLLLLASRSSDCPVAMSECQCWAWVEAACQHKVFAHVCGMWDAPGSDALASLHCTAKQFTNLDRLLCLAVCSCCRFCSGCIQTWLKEHISCPVCRWTFPEVDTRLINK
jgi:hypothetical protein